MDWRTANNQCLSNLNDMVSRYNKDVMMMEIGTPWDHSEAKAIVADAISKMRQVSGGRGQGVFYWEPQAYNWQGYSLGAWNPNTKRPAAGLDAFLEGAAVASKAASSRAASSRATSSRAASSRAASSRAATASLRSSSKTSATGQVCNWYGTRYPLCVTTTNGWGWENLQSCISRSTCSAQPAPYGITN
jgi:arabinogalactan endo-1,4-beta-galactosidase